MRRVILILVMLTALVSGARAAVAWEETERAPVSVERVEGDTPFEMATSGSYLYVTVSKPVTVKVFTILGQLISSQTLQPGIHRLRMSSRGIYILKIGSVTRRITI